MSCVSRQAPGLRRVSRPISLNGYKPTLSMIRADGQLQRRSAVDVDMGLLRQSQHVEEWVGEKPASEQASSRIAGLNAVARNVTIIVM